MLNCFNVLLTKSTTVRLYNVKFLKVVFDRQNPTKFENGEEESILNQYKNIPSSLILRLRYLIQEYYFRILNSFITVGPGLQIKPSFMPIAVWCVSYQSLSRSWHTDLDCGSHRLPDLEIGPRRVWPVDRGRLLLLSSWSHPWYIKRSVFVPFSDLYFLQDLWDWLLFVIYAIFLIRIAHSSR
jgi:hypothetical protein